MGAPDAACICLLFLLLTSMVLDIQICHSWTLREPSRMCLSYSDPRTLMLENDGTSTEHAGTVGLKGNSSPSIKDFQAGCTHLYSHVGDLQQFTPVSFF